MGKHMGETGRRFWWVIGLSCCIFAGSCDIRPAGTAVQFDRATFNREKALWEAQGITGYAFTQIYFPDYPAGSVRFSIIEPGLDGGWYNVTIEDFVTL
jgi:hypothetical protein